MPDWEYFLRTVGCTNSHRRWTVWHDALTGVRVVRQQREISSLQKQQGDVADGAFHIQTNSE